MKIELIDSLDDLNLGVHQSFMALDKESDNYNSEVFSLFTGIDVEDVKNVPKKDFDEVINHIANSLQRKGEFKRTFTIDGVEFGLIPNFDKVLGNDNVDGSEYSDMILYSKFDESGYNPKLDRLMAVLYRPIKVKESFLGFRKVKCKDKYGNYLIEDYKGTSGHIQLINKLPMSIVNECLVFFFSLWKDLETHIQAYMEGEQARVQ